MRKPFSLLRRLVCASAAVGMVAVGAVAISAPTSGAAAAVTKTTVTFALLPGASPNYIFPFITFAKCSTFNLGWFQNMMYRNLYLYGSYANGTSTPTALDKKLSIGDTPVYSSSGETITITIKTYKWSNGEKVDATDVLFYFNMLHAAYKHYCYYFPGGLAMPTSIKNVTVTSPTKVTITLTTKVSEHWFTYNELSQISPFPMAWDVTALGASPNSGGCAKAAYGTADTKCTAVFDFLSEQAGFNPTKPTQTITAFSTYASSPIWSVVDGPFKLTSFGATAPIVMVPNPTYSGPNKPKIKKFIEKPFASTTAEFNALVAGTVNIGYLPLTDVTSNATPGKTSYAEPITGKNNSRVATTFTLASWWLEAITYFPLNFKSVGDGGNAGKIFTQSYFRQALQSGVDETAYIKSIFKGYGVPTFGPVPVVPPSPYASKQEEKNENPYTVSHGTALLKSHGWKIVPTGTDTCAKPGTKSNECGKGIPKGAKLTFSIEVASTPKVVGEQTSAEKAEWSRMGINVKIETGTFNSVIGTAVPCATAKTTCKWEMANWGAGWVFSPDYYPTGEEIFASGAGANSGLFTTKKADTLIKQTDISTVKLTQYENYVAKALPVSWQVEPGQGQFEIHKGLKGVTPFNPFDYFTAATFSWT